jgi:diguanylate cyclase (GGDEF)-like protein
MKYWFSRAGWVLLRRSAAPLRDAADRGGVYKIIERINLLYVDARSQSLKDELTQLPNRRFSSIPFAKRGGRLALMILDIDFFKKINDTWGHLVGDEVLFSLGKQLAKLTSDKVLPARIGGEEFAIIVDGLSAQEVHELAQSILQNARTILINHDNAAVDQHWRRSAP